MSDDVWIKAKDLQPGDRIRLDDGGTLAILAVETANWIKTAEGPCMWIFYRGGDQVAGKSDEFLCAPRKVKGS